MTLLSISHVALLRGLILSSMTILGNEGEWGVGRDATESEISR